MRVALIVLAVLGLAFVALMLLVPAYVPSQAENATVRSRIAEHGPPGFVSFLGGLMSPFAPSAKPVPAAGNCPPADKWALPKSATRFRVLHVRLAPGASAGRLVFTPKDPRQDGGSGPYVLCLSANGQTTGLPGGCKSPDETTGKIKAKGTLPVGPGGGCLFWQGIGANPAPPDFE